MKRFSTWILITGDLIVLTLFVIVGQREHELTDAADPVFGVIRGGAPFLMTWLAAAFILRAFDPNTTFWPFMGRTLNAWLVAVPLAILLRSLLLGRAVVPTVFLWVTYGVGFAFIGGWRIVFKLIKFPQFPKVP